MTIIYINTCIFDLTKTNRYDTKRKRGKIN